MKMDMYDLSAILKKYTPAHFQDIRNLLSSISDELEYTKAALSRQLIASQNLDDYTTAREILDAQEEILHWAAIIQKLLESTDFRNNESDAEDAVAVDEIAIDGAFEDEIVMEEAVEDYIATDEAVGDEITEDDAADDQDVEIELKGDPVTTAEQKEDERSVTDGTYGYEKERIDYSRYKTDDTIGYGIAETPVTFKRPAAFSIDGRKYPAETWKELFARVCEVLYSRDPEILKGMVDEKRQVGRRRVRMTYDKKTILRPVKIKGSSIWLETNRSASDIMKSILTLAERYGIPKEKIRVYFKRDYTGLHKEDITEI